MIKIKFVLVAAAWLAVFDAGAQVIPNTQTQPNATTQTLNPIPSSYSSTIALNMLRSWEAERPFTADTMITSNARSVQEVKQTTQYFDGLGRPIQTVVKGISPQGYDMVSPMLYDSLGREVFKYLPYVDTGTFGGFKANPFNWQSSFMTALYNPTSATNGEKFFYGQTMYEASPLNRVLASYAPGNSWAGSALGSAMQYQTSTLADSLVIWRVTYTMGLTPTNGGYYAYGQLLKTVATDEAGHQVVEYKDKDGRVVLKKAQSAATVPSTAYTGWLCTYYVYDDLGNLRFVMPPKTTDWLKANSWTFDATTIAASSISKELCFSYEYDQRNRMVVKRVPGAGEVWMVYDVRDRLVLTQDSALRNKGQWFYTSYDSLNRPILAGLWTSSYDRSTQKSYADTALVWPNPGTGTYTVLTRTHYDDYTWVAGTGSGLSANLITTYTGNTSYFYTASDATFPYPRSLTASNATRGLVTGTEVNVLNSSTYLYNVSFYDDRGRVIQAHSTNNSGGKDTLTTQYDFTGRPLRILENHGKAGVNTLNYVVLTKNLYDAAGRLVSVNKKVGNSLEDSLAVYSYDELGRLSLKKLGRARASLTNFAYTANPIDSLRYTYNIRGWVRGINKDYSNAANSAVNWFGMELNYDYGFNQSQFNGNIAGIKWRNKGDGQQRAYGFTYDAINRLTRADFTQYTGSAWNTSAGIDFTTRGITYDQNGNILTMNQVGLRLNTVAVIDSLLYGYNTNSNKLGYVTDRQNDTATLLGDFKEYNTGSTTDYSYDGNGNLTTDNNKRIANIHYNHLNLPDSITFTNKGYIKYVYDASGSKQQKITIDNSVTKKTVTSYIGPFIYQYTTTNLSGTASDTLQFILGEEGRVRPRSPGKSDTVSYDFFEKDHLGNTRVVLTDEQQQDVYPAATLENSSGSMAVEQTYYTITLADTISTSSIASWGSTSGNGYPNNNGNPPYNTNPSSNTSATSAVVYKLNGATGDKTGLGITLKVMTGDVVNIYGKSFWHNGTGSNPSNTYLINTVLNSFIGAFAGTSAVAGSGKGATAAALQGSTATYNGVNSWVTSGVPNPGLNTVPRAYINWILFNDQFVPVASNCGFDLVNTTADAVKSHSAAVSISASGYLYVYCSNESNLDVFFDNLQLVHTRGPLLETTEYYPFGLTMAGISDKALKGNYAENKLRYNKGSELQNKEFSDGSGLEMYETPLRSLDPQLGRWWQLDPKPTESESLYSSMGNNPILRNDPLGDTLDFPDASPEFIDQFYDAYAYLDAHGVGGYLLDLQRRPEHIDVIELKATITSDYVPDPTGENRPTIHWGPLNAITTTEGVTISPASVLNHEADHALYALRHPNATVKNDNQYGNSEEKRVIAGSEQKTAKALGEIKNGQVTRRNHKGHITVVANPTSTESVAEKGIFKYLKEKQDLQNDQNKVKPNPDRKAPCHGCAGPAKPGRDIKQENQE